jgi:hypothetical protein
MSAPKTPAAGFGALNAVDMLRVATAIETNKNLFMVVGTLDANPSMMVDSRPPVFRS